MAREIEVIDLDANRAIGGTSYHHSGQIIKVSYGSNDQFFLGDDYEEFSAKDALIRNIIDYQDNWRIRGDIFKIEDTDGKTLTVWTKTEGMDEDGNDILEDVSEDIYYEWVDCTVIVNHKTKFEMVIKKGAVSAGVTQNKICKDCWCDL
jgi:hypothetical protein